MKPVFQDGAWKQRPLPRAYVDRIDRFVREGDALLGALRGMEATGCVVSERDRIIDVMDAVRKKVEDMT